VSFAFLKGHGTRNDFIVLPDLDGSVHGELSASVVVALCDRRAGLGADGVLRVLASGGSAPWFMDYRNADGSLSEMCGNGVRVFARYLEASGLVDRSEPLRIDTRGGVKQVTFCDDEEISVEMGTPMALQETFVSSAGVEYPARAVDVGNPHAVVRVASLEDLGELREAPAYSTQHFPHGVNVEFVEVRGDGRLAMRVYERGVGETASCGTGAVAAAVAVRTQLGEREAASYAVDVPGGRLTVIIDADGCAHLKGPAVLVADGIWTGGAATS
jgi:diaminopimelate epimerase